MKRFFKVLLAAWLTGAIGALGAACGFYGLGLVVKDGGPSAHDVFLAAQIAEMQSTLEAFSPYDQIAANPIDEFAGME